MHEPQSTILDQWVVSFVTTAISAVLWPSLPPAYSLPLIFIVALLSPLFPLGRMISGAAFAVLWLASVGHWQTSWQLPEDDIRQITQIQGQITTIVRQQQQVRFNLDLDQAALGDRSVDFFIPPKVRLSWRNPNVLLKEGMVVRLTVKLKPRHGLSNQGGFRYQQWLLSQGIVATGYVKTSPQNILIEYDNSLRQRLLDRLAAYQVPNEAWIAALAFGDRSLINQTQWQHIQNSGVAHLIAISGLHLGIVAGLCFAVLPWLLKGWLWWRNPSQASQFRPTLLIIMLLCALVYGVLAGLALPTVRALVMLTLFCTISILYRNWSYARKLLYCLAIVLFIDPLSPLGASFWLTFSAVAVIGVYLWRWPLPAAETGLTWIDRLKVLFHFQWIMSLSTVPLTLLWFQFVSPLSPLVNLIAVPLVSLILVPLCLLLALLLLFDSALTVWVLRVVDTIAGYFADGLALIYHHAPLQWQVSEMPLAVIVALILALIPCYLPKLTVPRWGMAIMILPMFSYLVPTHHPFWELHVLDVGQGLSVVLLKDHRAIIYDTGASYPSGFNMADAVLLPFLQANGVRAVNTLILSHFDNDHAGASIVLSEKIPIKQTLSTRDHCYRGWQMQWFNLQIESLWPQKSAQTSNNDTSCVIRITDGQNTVLLSGDISESVEQILVAQQPIRLRANILLAPHHGSATSSSVAFIQQVDPDVVIYSQGFDNQWGFPRARVVQRYVAQNVRQLATSESGQIRVRFYSGSEPHYQVHTFKQDLQPRWYLTGGR